jgi:hypothetical protein
MPPRLTAPAELTSYSNDGYPLLGFLVEQAFGIPFRNRLDASMQSALYLINDDGK